MAVRLQPKLTYQDYLLFPDDGRRRELIDGEVYVMPSPSARHQDVTLELAWVIKQHLKEHGGGRVFIAPFDVVLSDVNVVQPDAIFISDQDAGVITEANIQGVPTLVIEVLSDPGRDHRLKRDLYARYGIAEYWVVDPIADRVEVYRPSNKGYAKPEILEPGETLTTEAIPRLTLDLAALLKRYHPR